MPTLEERVNTLEIQVANLIRANLDQRIGIAESYVTKRRLADLDDQDTQAQVRRIAKRVTRRR